MRANKLVNDTMLYAAANFGSGILAFLMLPLYTYYFTTSEYGYWDVVVTTVTLLSPIITFELVSAVYRWLLVEKDEDRKVSIITTGLIRIIQNMLIIDVIVLIIGWFLPIPYFWLAFVYMHVVILVSFMQQCARGLNRNKLFAGMGILQTVLTISAILFFILGMHMRIEAFFFANIFSGICIVAFAWYKLKFGQFLRLRSYSKSMLRSFLTYSLPIIPGAASWWLMTMSDRYFIIGFLGMEENGIYALANKIPAILLMVNSVFALAWKDQAILSFSHEEKNAFYSNVFRYFFRLMASIFICICLLAKPVLAMAVSASFLASWKYVGILLLGTVFHAFALFWAAGYHGAKKTTVIFTTSTIGAVVNILLNFVLIRYFGLYAVAMATTAAFLITWIIRIKSSKKHFHIHLPKTDMLVLFPIMCAAIIAPFILDEIAMTFISCFAIILFFILNWRLLRMVWRQLAVKWQILSRSH